MKKGLIVFAAFAAVLGINLYFRAFPAYFPQLRQAAAESVLNAKFAEISRSVRERFGALPSSTQERLARAQYAEYKRANAQTLKRQIADEYVRQKDRFQDKRGQTYLMELDCWHWMRYVSNVLDHGYPGDAVRDGRQIDTLMNSPEGFELPWNHFLFYLSAALYKLTAFFLPGLPLETFLFYLPLFFLAVFISVLFWFCLSSYGLVCAFVSCLSVGMAPVFIPRSVVGWFDMDILNMLLPLLAAVCYLLSFGKPARKRFLWVTAAAFWTGLFAFTWPYWFVFVSIVVAYEAFSLLDLLFSRMQYGDRAPGQAGGRLASIGLYCAGSVFFLLLFAGTAPLKALFPQILNSVRLNQAVVSVWPNVMSTVGELSRPDFNSIMNNTGDGLVFCLALVFMLALMLQHKRFTGFRRESILLFVVWFLVMFVISSRGVRMTMFLLIPLGIFLGLGLEETLALCERKRNWLGFAAAAVILFYAGFSSLERGYKVSREVFPLMDDGWYSLMNSIRQDTPAGSVISSWWDFGDWFKTAGGRPVIFDGQSQGSPRAYWMARVLLTGNETEAVNILRMLNNGGNRVFDMLENRFHDPYKALATVRQIVTLPREAAGEKLAGLLPAGEAARVEALIFDTPRHDGYLVVDSSMLMKMPSISFIGNWDAVKVYVARNISRRSEDDIKRYLSDLGLRGEDAGKLLLEAELVRKDEPSWITSTSHFYGSSQSTKTDEGLVLFANGSLYNPGTKKCYLYDARRRTFRIPRSVYLMGERGLQESVFPDGEEMDSAAVIIRHADGYELMLLSPALVKSMFFRLYFLNGRGCADFLPFAREDGVASVYKIRWEEPHGDGS